jgi:hypothetical protein
MNPARALGAMLTSPWDAPWMISWIYVVGPILGAGLGLLLGEWFISEPRKIFFLSIGNLKLFSEPEGKRNPEKEIELAGAGSLENDGDQLQNEMLDIEENQNENGPKVSVGVGADGERSDEVPNITDEPAEQEITVEVEVEAEE